MAYTPKYQQNKKTSGILIFVSNTAILSKYKWEQSKKIKADTKIASALITVKPSKTTFLSPFL